MLRYRKKPVVVEVMEYTGTTESAAAIMDWIDKEQGKRGGARLVGYDMDRLMVCTLEGNMEASPGDFIIKGVAGEFYPCKPVIFHATYEPAAP